MNELYINILSTLTVSHEWLLKHPLFICFVFFMRSFIILNNKMAKTNSSGPKQEQPGPLASQIRLFESRKRGGLFGSNNVGIKEIMKKVFKNGMKEF